MRWLLLLVVLTGCVHRLSSDMNGWVGQSSDALISAWGAPARSADLSDGGKVLTWETRTETNSGEPTRCVRSFTVSPEHRITKWSTAGCPAIVR